MIVIEDKMMMMEVFVKAIWKKKKRFIFFHIYEYFTCESLSLLTDGKEFESELSPSAS